MTPYRQITVEELAEIILAKVNPITLANCDLYIKSSMKLVEFYKLMGKLPSDLARLDRMYGDVYLQNKPSTLWNWLTPNEKETKVEWAVRNATGILEFGGTITCIGFDTVKINLGPTRKLRDPLSHKVIKLDIDFLSNPTPEKVFTENDLKSMNNAELLNLVAQNPNGTLEANDVFAVLVTRTMTEKERYRYCDLRRKHYNSHGAE
jgi:hypothetical protein